MTVKFYFLGMNSMWLCADPVCSIDLKKHSHVEFSGAPTQKHSIPSQNSPYLGIFKDHPINIGKRIKRPLTPFSFPANGISMNQNFKKSNYQPDFDPIISISPPSISQKFDTSQDNGKNGCNFNVISIF